MYRIVFTSTDPRTRRMKKECGPWQEKKSVCEYWVSYFEKAGHGPRMVIEASAGAMGKETMDLGGMVV